MLLFTLPSFAGTIGTSSDGYQPFTIEANPTARQITKLFIETTEGTHDPFMVLSKVGSMGNGVVPALRTCLFNAPVIKIALSDPNGLHPRNGNFDWLFGMNGTIAVFSLFLVHSLIYRLMTCTSISDNPSMLMVPISINPQ